MSEKLNRFYCGKWFVAVLGVSFFLIPFIVHFSSIKAGDILVSGDGLLTAHVQMYMGDSLRNLDFPLWTPYLAGGMPFAQDVSMSALYPPLWICSMLPALLQLYVYFGLHYALGGVLMFLFLQKLNCSRVISLTMSVTYLFTVHMGGARKEHVALIVTAIYLPVILYFIERYLESRGIRWLLWASGAMALQFLGGFLQYVVYSDIVIFAYFLFSGIHQKSSWKHILKYGAVLVGSYFGLISVCVIPMVQMLLRLSSSGGSNMALELFAGLSLHPIKLLMSVFPRIFGPGVWGWGIERNFSSGMDAELILSAAFVSLILCSVFLWKRNFRIRMMLGIAICTLGYACIGQFPVVAKILFRIPIINMFRVPSRTIFLFTFCCIVLGALTLQALCDEKSTLKFMHIVHVALLIFMVAVFLLYIARNGIEANPEPLSRIFAVPFVSFAIYLVIFCFSLWLRKKNRMTVSFFRIVLAFTVMGVTILNTFPYYKYSAPSNLQDHLAFPDQITETIENNKIWAIDRQAQPKLSANYSMVSKTSALNSYTNFNLPGIFCYTSHATSAPLNSSGLYMSFGNANHTLQKDNAFISMMGVKYIVTQPQAGLEHYTEILGYTSICTLLEESEANLKMASDYRICAWPVALDPDSYYKVSFAASVSQPTQLYVDFADVGYDFTEQEAGFAIREGAHNYEDVVFSGDSTVASNIMFRIVSPTGQEVHIRNIKVEKIQPLVEELYTPFMQEVDYTVYENKNAKQLLYAPERVDVISEEEKMDLYVNTHNYDILNTSYITEGTESHDFSDANIQIEDIVLTNNKVSAMVSAGKPGFINMSQNCYPGWNAYIDGEKIKVYEVNGIIQGVFVPAGKYILEFKFQPTLFFVGIIVSGATLAICWFACRCFRAKNEKEDA